MLNNADLLAAERRRIKAEYSRRERDVSPDLYAPWSPAEMLMRAERKRIAAVMLHEAAVFPQPSSRCLEVGVGSLGWLGDLISWGVKETSLHGIELDSTRLERAQELLPLADLRGGDAAQMPWPDGCFHLVIASTVFTSILDDGVRNLVAEEITRVLAPGGALLWYDFAFNNPKNRNVRRVDRKELQQLFPMLRGWIRSVTLFPPLARVIAPKSWTLACALGSIPLIRTHLLAVLIKPQ